MNDIDMLNNAENFFFPEKDDESVRFARKHGLITVRERERRSRLFKILYKVQLKILYHIIY